MFAKIELSLFSPIVISDHKYFVKLRSGPPIMVKPFEEMLVIGWSSLPRTFSNSRKKVTEGT